MAIAGNYTITPSGSITITVGGSGSGRNYHLIDPSKSPTTDNILSTVQGEMLYTEITMTEYDMLRKNGSGMTYDEFKESIKLDLCYRMAMQLFKSKMVEFTEERRVDTNSRIFRARIFATPDTQVQLIRKFHQSIK